VTIRIKKACSLNGSNEFLKEIGIVQYNDSYNGIHSIIFDSRGVVVVTFKDVDI